MNKLLLLTLLVLMAVPMVCGEETNKKYADGLPDLIPYRKGDKWGFCDKDKNIVIECKYDEVGMFYEGFSKVKLNKSYGIINELGKEIIPIKYDDISLERKRLKNNKYKFIRKKINETTII